MGVSVGLLMGRVWNGGSDLQAGVEIYYCMGAPPNFGSFRAAKMTPFWDPYFTPPCGLLAAPYLYAHDKAWTQFQVVHSDIGPRSCLLSREPLALPWPGEPRVRMMPILVILAS